jgi:hypothetical protein
MVGTSAGTPDYMAPEQFAASDDIDYSRSDIYAVGTMLYRMVTGELPFKGDNEFLLRDAKLTEKPARPSELNDSVSRELDGIILKSISSDPEERFRSVGEMREKLDEIRQARKSAETIASIREPEIREKPVRDKSGGRKKSFYITAAAVIAAAAAVYLLLIRPAPAPTAEITVTVAPASNIYIDGRLSGRSTSVHSALLEEGEHTIRIENESALFDKEILDTVILREGASIQKDYSFRGALDIRIEPAGAVYVDDSLISGSAEEALVLLEPGRHLLRVSNPAAAGRKEFIDTVQVAANLRLEREFSFRMPAAADERQGEREEPERQQAPDPGRLLVGSRPRFADIYINGELQEYKTPYTFDLPPGRHTVRIVIVEGGKSYEETFNVVIKSGRTEKINFKPLE